MSPGRFPPELLRSLRNDIPIDALIRSRSDLPSKESEGHLRFLCPLCTEFHTATNPKTNLARCFRCAVNFNPIDLVMVLETCAFVDAVKILLRLRDTGLVRSPSRKTLPEGRAGSAG